MSLRRSSLPALGIALLVAACGGDDPTAPDVVDPPPPEETRVVKDNPAFVADIYEIFTRRGCTASGCHGSGQGGLTMSSAAGAYAALVGVASQGNGETLVIAGDAASSYLVKKLTGAAGIVGARMPLGGAQLDDIDLGNIRNWINNGAPNN